MRGNGRRDRQCCTPACLLYVTLIYVRPAEIVPRWETIPFVDILTGISAFVGVFSLSAKPRPVANLPHDKLFLDLLGADRGVKRQGVGLGGV